MQLQWNECEHELVSTTERFISVINLGGPSNPGARYKIQLRRFFGTYSTEKFSACARKVSPHAHIKSATESAQRRGVLDRVSANQLGIVVFREMRQGLVFNFSKTSPCLKSASHCGFERASLPLSPSRFTSSAVRNRSRTWENAGRSDFPSPHLTAAARQSAEP